MSPLDQIMQQQAEILRLRRLLRQVQWVEKYLAVTGEAYDSCPLCDQVKKNGHSPDCPIGLELGLNKPKPGPFEIGITEDDVPF